ncbi:hypothetical protein [Streptosporangium sp. NPDC020145]|uniref:hypothetical protein n=1 Tax=Streptosporangium sp. NPDC020145 TaxID=3154694 RepID=UPI00342462B3
MYVHATPSEFESAPVHGAYPADAARVPVTLRLELTQEEAASVLAAFSIGMRENDPRITPADGPRIAGQILTDVVLQAVREAALTTLDQEQGYPQSTGFYNWCRRMVAPTIPAQRTQAQPALTGTAVTR